jgi:hypothetical protein
MPYKDRQKERESKHTRYEEKKKDPSFVLKQKKYRDDNAEANREYQRIYRLTHAEQLVELVARRKHLWKSKRKDYHNEYHRQYHQKYRQEVLRVYGGKCVCCGEQRQEFLQVDHSNNDGSQHRKLTGGGHSFYRWLVKNGCPKDGFRLLCANCNFARGRYGYCPHENEKITPKGVESS